MEAFIFLFGFLIGAGLAGVFNMIDKKSMVMGTLKIDRSDENQDKYLFEIDSNMDDIPNKKQVLLNVEVSH